MDIKQKAWIERLISNIGKKNYEQKLKENPEEYKQGYNTPKKIKQIIKQIENKGANIYKGYPIPLKYKNKTLNEYLKNNNRDKTLPLDNININGLSAPLIHRKKLSNGLSTGGKPITRYFKPMLEEPVAMTKYIIGHELGHAKYQYDQDELLEIVDKLHNEKKFKQAKQNATKYAKLKQKYNKINSDGSLYKEELADKNVSNFLKQMGIPKKDRQAIYYMKKNIYPNREGRYQGKFGNLKYLKDYIFGFSDLPAEYYSYKPLTPEWKRVMKQYFYQIYFDAQKKR